MIEADITNKLCCLSGCHGVSCAEQCLFFTQQLTKRLGQGLTCLFCNMGTWQSGVPRGRLEVALIVLD